MTDAPTPEQIAAAQEVLNQAKTAAAAAEAARIKPLTDFTTADATRQVRAALEALVPTFLNDPAYGAKINCALVGLKGLGVALPEVPTA